MKDLLKYDPETGDFIWKVQKPPRRNTIHINHYKRNADVKNLYNKSPGYSYLGTIYGNNRTICYRVRSLHCSYSLAKN